jgi:hypothetical protein
MPNIPQTTFNGGEQTPEIAERIDTEKNSSGCKRLDNLIPRIYGSVVRRPGTIHVFGNRTPLAFGMGKFGLGKFGVSQ